MKKIGALLLIGIFITTMAYADGKGSRGVSRSTVTTQNASVQKGSQQVTKTTVATTQKGSQQVTATPVPQRRVPVAQQPKPVVVRQAAPAPRQQAQRQSPPPQPVVTWDEYPCADCPIQIWSTSDYYPTKMGGQFLRGLINAATCWLELPRSIYIESRDGVPFVGTFVGIGEGTAYTLLRAGGGLFDIVTAIVPNYNNEVYYSDEEPIIFCEYMCG